MAEERLVNPGFNPMVLVVDRDKPTRELLKGELSKDALYVRCTDNESYATGLLSGVKSGACPDLVIIDPAGFADLNVRSIREIDPQIPLIVLSHNSFIPQLEGRSYERIFQSGSRPVYSKTVWFR